MRRVNDGVCDGRRVYVRETGESRARRLDGNAVGGGRGGQPPPACINTRALWR
jgi:hypothetical protein